MRPMTPLMSPTSATRGWQLQGGCRDADPDLFFHHDTEWGSVRRHREAAALRVCAECPVLRPCRQYALAQREIDGVWGGLTQEQRHELWAGAARSTSRG